MWPVLQAEGPMQMPYPPPCVALPTAFGGERKGGLGVWMWSHGARIQAAARQYPSHVPRSWFLGGAKPISLQAALTSLLQ